MFEIEIREAGGVVGMLKLNAQYKDEALDIARRFGMALSPAFTLNMYEREASYKRVFSNEVAA